MASCIDPNLKHAEDEANGLPQGVTDRRDDHLPFLKKKEKW